MYLGHIYYRKHNISPCVGQYGCHFSHYARLGNHLHLLYPKECLMKSLSILCLFIITHFALVPISWAQDHWNDTGTPDTTGSIWRTENVGLGTTSPGQLLEIADANHLTNFKFGLFGYPGQTGGGLATVLANYVNVNTTINTRVDYVTASSGACAIEMEYTKGIRFFTKPGSQNIGNAFYTDSNRTYERLQINNSGYVRIGNTNPSHVFTVGNSIDKNGQILIEGDDDSDAIRFNTGDGDRAEITTKTNGLHLQSASFGWTRSDLFIQIPVISASEPSVQTPNCIIPMMHKPLCPAHRPMVGFTLNRYVALKTLWA